MLTFISIYLPLNIIYSVILYFTTSHNTVFNYLYNLSYGLYYLLVAYFCLKNLKKNKTNTLSLYLYLGIGSLSFFLAQLIWISYNLSGLNVPYPGLADLFWVIYYPLTALGMYQVARLIGIRFEWGRFVGVVVTFGVNLLLLYSFMSKSLSPDPSLLVNILNWSYPVFDALLLTMSLTMIRSQLGHLQPQLLYFVASFIFLAFGDAIFAYQTSLDLYWNGNLVDALYALSGALFLLGVHSLPKIIYVDRLNPTTASSNT